MKNVLVVLLIGAGFASSCAQDVPQKNVPSVVLNAFMTSYPQAADIEWELRGSVYNVEFEIGKVDHEAWYDASGKILKHQEDIKLSELPAAVADVIKKDFSDYKPDDADKIEENGKVFYKVELDGSVNDKVLLISPEGKILENKVDY